ncbi:hypothetical protein BJ170DRAFT_589094 [Xylariales sp. AK1849]|nr:hypothetical protein BJ170DRAFT_589094 [Xylariales sp. AK1849]
MISFIAKQISIKILGENVENNWGSKDPLFEYVPATKLDGKPTGKMKRGKRAVPPGISEHDAQILNKVKRRAYKMDSSLFTIAGIRFGWSSVIGLVPFAGDAVDFFMAVMVIMSNVRFLNVVPSSVVNGLLVHLLLTVP